MRITRIVFAVAFTAFAVASWAKYDAVSQPRLTFADRWAPVDAASQSGEFRQR
jgi:cytochrome c-type biogenesis protein CcmH/NrfG